MVNSGQLIVRNYGPEETRQLISLFRTTVRPINGADYSAQQLAAWAPDVIDEEEWQRRQVANTTLVATLDQDIVGFAELAFSGVVHMLFVSAMHQRRGVAAALLAALEKKALLAGETLLTTFASKTARTFFAGQGYRMVRPNQVIIEGLVLENFYMEKTLTPLAMATD